MVASFYVRLGIALGLSACISYSAHAQDQRRAACGVLELDPLRCLVFRPDFSTQTLLLENTGAFGPDARVFVSGLYVASAQGCTNRVGPAIIQNSIAPCYEAFGQFLPSTECDTFRADGTNSIVVVQNRSGFDPGRPVFVRGGYVTNSTLCPVIPVPSVENNVTLNLRTACGELIIGPAGCFQFLADHDDVYYNIENTGAFQSGDRVFVRGAMNFQSFVCSDQPTNALERNLIAPCFETCGRLVVRGGCLIFRADTSEEYALDTTGAFGPDQRVRVTGLLDPTLDPNCPAGSGRVRFNSITLCCACDWDRNGLISSEDFFLFLDQFFQSRADFNLDGIVNSADFFDFLSCFFTRCI